MSRLRTDRSRLREDGAATMIRVQLGDEEAFKELWCRYRRLVYGIALKMLGQRSIAEDITQLVFLKVWTKPQAFRGGSFGSWISRVTRNLAVDEFRRSSCAVFVEFDPEAPVEEQLAELVSARLDAEHLRDVLRTVPEERRILIELSFFEGKTHEEIAAIMHLPLGTVKTRIRAGIGHLRSSLLDAPAAMPPAFRRPAGTCA